MVEPNHGKNGFKVYTDSRLGPQSDQSVCRPDEAYMDQKISTRQKSNNLIRLGRCACWTKSSLRKDAQKNIFSNGDSR